MDGDQDHTTHANKFCDSWLGHLFELELNPELSGRVGI
jgi:hypothetical protein